MAVAAMNRRPRHAAKDSGGDEGHGAAFDEHDLVRRLKAGDEEAFAALVERHHAGMVRVARGYVRSRAVAEEVATRRLVAVGVTGLALTRALRAVWPRGQSPTGPARDLLSLTRTGKGP